MDLLGKPFVNPATPAAAGTPAQTVTPLALRAADLPSQAAGSVRNQARPVTSTGARADWRNDRADFGDSEAEIRVSLVAHQPPGRGPSP